jgi:hypothetical protein
MNHPLDPCQPHHQHAAQSHEPSRSSRPFPYKFPLTQRDGIVSTSACLPVWICILPLLSLSSHRPPPAPDAITVSGSQNPDFGFFSDLSRIPLPIDSFSLLPGSPLVTTSSRPRDAQHEPDTKPIYYDLLPTSQHRRRRRHHRDLPNSAHTHTQASRRRPCLTPHRPHSINPVQRFN